MLGQNLRSLTQEVAYLDISNPQSQMEPCHLEEVGLLNKLQSQKKLTRWRRSSLKVKLDNQHRHSLQNQQNNPVVVVEIPKARKARDSLKKMETSRNTWWCWRWVDHLQVLGRRSLKMAFTLRVISTYLRPVNKLRKPDPIWTLEHQNQLEKVHRLLPNNLQEINCRRKSKSSKSS